jgi:hypothetical protein
MTIKNLPLAIKILLLVSHLSWSPRQNILILKRIDPTLFCLIVMHKICIWLEQDCATFKPVSLFGSLVMVKLVRIRDLDARLKRNEKILWIYAINTEKRLTIKMISGQFCYSVTYICAVLSSIIGYRAQPDWAYGFPDRTGPDTQICLTGPAGPHWIPDLYF